MKLLGLLAAVVGFIAWTAAVDYGIPWTVAVPASALAVCVAVAVRFAGEAREYNRVWIANGLAYVRERPVLPLKGGVWIRFRYDGWWRSPFSRVIGMDICDGEPPDDEPRGRRWPSRWPQS